MPRNKKLSPRALIPANAREEIVRTYENGQKAAAYYSVRDKRILFRTWDNAGRVQLEYGMRDGLMHGPYRSFHENGVVSWTTAYIHGKEHGVSRQFNTNGALIGTYRMRHGTGVDLWFSAPGVLSEERHFKDGHLNGFERWWKTRRIVWEEKNFGDDLEHGIHRVWNEDGKLRRGYPKYFIMGKPVSKRAYLKACESDPSLPPFRERENKPRRVTPSQPPDLVRQRKGRRVGRQRGQTTMSRRPKR